MHNSKTALTMLAMVAVAVAVAACVGVATHTPTAILTVIPGAAKYKARGLVENAVRFHRQNGADAGVAAVKNSAVDGEFYVFVINADNYEVAANPAFPNVVGKKLTELKAPDGSGLQHLADDATADGNWIRWHWFNPQTQKPQDKIGWLVKVDNYVYGAGVYVDGE